MKILLLRPKPQDHFFTAPHTGLCYIKACLVREGYKDSKVMDVSQYDAPAVRKLLHRENPAVVGITCLTETRTHSLALAKAIKEADPAVQIVFGGVHASCMYRQLLEHYPFIDYVCIGEGEITFPELIKALESGAAELRGVQGIAYRDNGQVVETPPRPQITDLDSLPFPDYDDFDLSQYDISAYYETKPMLFLVSSRGCVHRCTFCSTTAFWGGWRRRSARSIVEEMEYVVARYGVKTIKFADDIFTVDKRRVIQMCDLMMERKLDIGWSGLTRADYFSKDMALKMKASGCKFVSFGAESGSNEVLRLINKRQTREDIIKAVNICHEVGITVEMSLIVGSPGETKETLEDTKRLIREARPDINSVSLMTLLPNTPLYRQAREQGLCGDDFWLSDEPRYLYTGALSKEQMYAAQRELFITYALSKGVQGWLRTLKYGARVFLRQPRKMLPHFLVPRFVGASAGPPFSTTAPR